MTYNCIIFSDLKNYGSYKNTKKNWIKNLCLDVEMENLWAQLEVSNYLKPILISNSISTSKHKLYFKSS